MAASNPGLQKFLLGAIGLPAGLVMVYIPALDPCIETHTAYSIRAYQHKASGAISLSWHTLDRQQGADACMHACDIISTQY